MGTITKIKIKEGKMALNINDLRSVFFEHEHEENEKQKEQEQAKLELAKTKEARQREQQQTRLELLRAKERRAEEKERRAEEAQAKASGTNDLTFYFSAGISFLTIFSSLAVFVIMLLKG